MMIYKKKNASASDKGMDFVAWSVVMLEEKNASLTADSVAGNMSEEMSDAFWECYYYHKNNVLPIYNL